MMKGGGDIEGITENVLTFILIYKIKILGRLDCWERIKLGRVHFGVFSTSRFVPLALSSDYSFVF